MEGLYRVRRRRHRICWLGRCVLGALSAPAVAVLLWDQVSRNSSFASQLPPSHLRGHRPALSLHTPSTAGGRRSPVPPSVIHGNNTGTPKHGRSVSIVSLGTDAGTEVSHDRGIPIRRPARGHGRSASLQVVPGRPNSYPSMKDTRDICFWLTW